MPGVCSPGAWGGSHRPHSQPHLGPRPSHVPPQPPQHLLGQEVGRTSRAHTHLQFLSGPVSSIFRGLWPGRSAGPLILSLLCPHPGPLLTTRCLHPYWAILLTACLLHPCPSALHSLWADPWSLPTPLAPRLPILCFLLSHSPSLSFLPLSAALYRSLKPPLSITQWTGLRYCRHLSPRPFLGQEVWAQEEGVDGDLGEAFVPMLESRCVVT